MEITFAHKVFTIQALFVVVVCVTAVTTSVNRLTYYIFWGHIK